MTDTLTPTIRLTEPTPGGDSGTWATLLNSNLAYIDEAINQSITVSIADVNVVLIADGTVSDQARYLRYNFTGALTADRTVTLPANVKVGYASNNTTGGHNVILSAGGITISLPDSAWTFFNCSGTDISTQVVRFGAIESAGALTLPAIASAVVTNSNIAIDLSSAGMSLHMSAGGSAVFDWVASSSTFGWGVGATTPMSLNGNNGNLSITGTLSQASDRRLKRKIKRISADRGLEWLTAATPVEYEMHGRPTAGLIAQDQIASGFDRGIYLHPNPKMRATKDSPAGQQYVLDLESRVAYLIAALKGAVARIESLEARR